METGIIIEDNVVKRSNYFTLYNANVSWIANHCYILCANIFTHLTDVTKTIAHC